MLQECQDLSKTQTKNKILRTLFDNLLTLFQPIYVNILLFLSSWLLLIKPSAVVYILKALEGKSKRFYKQWLRSILLIS